MTDINETTAKSKGWTPERRAKQEATLAAKRAWRHAPREAPRQEAPQKAPRAGDVEYTADGKVIAYSSTGEQLTRKRTSNTGDLFHIPREIIPPGTDYQWNQYEVLGQPQTAAIIAMRENGWRPVPAGRHKGQFMPHDWPDNGDIVRDGLRLEERPMVLTLEARAEEARKAGQLVQDQQEQLGLSAKMPDGFSRQNSKLRAMERAGTSRTYAPEPGIPRPRLPIDPAA